MIQPVLSALNFELRAASLIAGVAMVLLLGFALRRLWGTTLSAPCLWAMGVCGCLTIVAECHLAGGGVLSPMVRFAVAAATFCPLMAVLGAKRPQHRGWQWVVASLWLVLVWPAGQALLSRSQLSLFVAWKMFLVGLVVVGLANYLSTRNWISALFVAAGQLALLMEFIWPQLGFDPGQMLCLAILCFAVAGLIVFLRTKIAANGADQSSFGLDLRTAGWRAFRDSFGSLWGLRIQGRVNETAELRDWSFRLRWTGFERTSDVVPTDIQLQELDESWLTLMRRFW